MAGFLRQVIARFDVDVNDKKLTELDRKLKAAKESVNSLGAALGVAWAAGAAGAYGLVTMASDAAEQLNVLQQTFKGNSDAVVEWARTVGKEMGRSQYTLMDAAGRFGSFLSPMLKNSSADVTDMSEKLSQLAVDLASFYNTSDEEAVMRLFSGMSGETEAVRRLGIDISDAALEAKNKERGDMRAYNQISTQDKTMLRFLKIMEDSIDKQGDAIRTQDQWANSVKRARERLKTLGTELGQRLIPVFLKMLHWVEASFMPVFEELAKKAVVLESALKLLTGATMLTAAAWMALNAPLALLGTTLLASVALFDEINTMMSTNGPTDTMLGSVVKDVWGIDMGKALERAGLAIIGIVDVVVGALTDLAINLGRVWDMSIISKGISKSNTEAAWKRAHAGKQTPEGQARQDDAARLRAAGAMDIEAFKATYKGQQMTESQLKSEYLKYYTMGMQEDLKAAGPKMEFKEDRLIKEGASGADADELVAIRNKLNPAPDFATLSNAQRSFLPGGSGNSGQGNYGVVVNMTVGDIVAKSPEELRKAVHDGVNDALTKRNKRTAAAVAEER